MSGPLLFTQVEDKLLFKLASSSTKNDAVLSISPNEHDFTLAASQDFPARGDIRKIAALIGVIKLKTNKYAIIANRVEDVGKLNGNTIFKLVEHKIVPVNKDLRKDNDESQYLSLLETHLSNSTLYFSYTYDLTNSVQRNEELNAGSGKAVWQKADERFFWNHYVTQDLQKLSIDDPRVSDFIQPMIYGYAKVVDTVFNATPISIGLITRRSRLRAGTRYFRRGIDSEGNVSNFNETEQVLLVQNGPNGDSDFFSFLQTRGSVPVYWAEVNNLKYKPSLVLGENSSLEATKKHFEEQKSLYGENFLVNLVNQKGYEVPVKEAYELAVNSLYDPKIHYVYFDFHHECRKMQWHRVKLLINHLKELGLSSKDVFHKTIGQDGSTKKIVSKQQSVVRTNCMDCLDRTNVVQSVLAHWVLQQEFETAGVISSGDIWENDKKLLFEFQNFWADNADAVSCAYSGTGALKTDFTRTGNRTKVGALNDLMNSLSRYYQNNLTDGPRQDSYDLFLGNFKPFETTIQSPFPDRRPLLIQAVPTIIYAAVTVIAATIFFPKEHFTSFKNLAFLFSSSAVLILATRFIFQNGEQYVNWPKLADLGFLVAVHTHDKEHQFRGIKYVPSTKFSKPNVLKRD